MVGLCGVGYIIQGTSSKRPCVRAIVVFFSFRSTVRLIGSIMLANWFLHVHGSEFIDVINVKSFSCGGVFV